MEKLAYLPQNANVCPSDDPPPADRIHPPTADSGHKPTAKMWLIQCPKAVVSEVYARGSLTAASVAASCNEGAESLLFKVNASGVEYHFLSCFSVVL